MSPRRTHIAAACLALCRALAAPAGTSPDGEEGDTPFPEEGDAAAAEARLADRLPKGRLEVRWRSVVRGAEGVQLYEQADWEPFPGVAAHLLAERDPGERRWADFASGYAAWRAGRGQVVLGHLRPAFGQGLVFGRGGSRGSSGIAPQRDRWQPGYRSSAENGAVSGVLAALHRGGASAAVLAARLVWDGRVDEGGTITSLPESGSHVSPAEEASRDRLRGAAVGGCVRYAGPRGGGGAQVLGVHLGHQLDLRRPDRVAWAFHGRHHWLASADLRWQGEGQVAYGEAAVDGGGRLAGLAGLSAGSGPLRLAGAAWRYPPGWHSFLGGAAGASDTGNEAGARLEAAGRGWRAYAAQDRSLQPVFTDPLPEANRTWGAQLDQRLWGAWRGRVAAQARSGSSWSGGARQRESSRSGRLELERSRGQARWRLRLEGRAARSGGRTHGGTLAAAAWRLRRPGGELALHVSGFCAPAWAARVYEYESNLPGAVSIPALYGRGWRAYGIARRRWGSTWVGLRCRRLSSRGSPPRWELSLQVDASAGSSPDGPRPGDAPGSD
ncbi:MAG: hypothetical protein ABIL09_27610 [Gemmatimonadota bacterium]